MKKNNKEEYLDDYYEDDNLYSEIVTDDYSDVSYNDFNKVSVEVEKPSKTEKVEKKKNDVDDAMMQALTYFSIGFRYFGMFLAFILIVYFISKGQFGNLLLYILLLIGSFFFGYGFMYLFTKYKDKN